MVRKTNAGVEVAKGGESMAATERDAKGNALPIRDACCCLPRRAITCLPSCDPPPQNRAKVATLISY